MIIVAKPILSYRQQLTVIVISRENLEIRGDIGRYDISYISSGND